MCTPHAVQSRLQLAYAPRQTATQRRRRRCVRRGAHGSADQWMALATMHAVATRYRSVHFDRCCLSLVCYSVYGVRRTLHRHICSNCGNVCHNYVLTRPRLEERAAPLDGRAICGRAWQVLDHQLQALYSLARDIWPPWAAPNALPQVADLDTMQRHKCRTDLVNNDRVIARKLS